MAYTKSNLTEEVIGELFQLGSGQTPNAEDTAWVEARINATLAELAKLQIIYVPDAENVADEAFNGLVAYMTEVCGPKFGRPRDPAAKLAAENRLRAIQRMVTGTGQPMRVDLGLLPRRRIWQYRW